MYIFLNAGIYLYKIFLFYPVHTLYVIIVRDGKLKKNAIKRAFAGK